MPVAAWLLPRLGDGDTGLTVPTRVQLPTALTDMLTALPTGWGYGAVVARDGAGWNIVMLLALGALLHLVWIALTAHALRRSPRRAAPKRPAAPGRGLPWSSRAPQVSAVAARELATWTRDPARGVELRTVWLTPLLMALIIGATDWSWALPLAGPAAAVFGAMVAINTYARDGTALWQLLTTPGAIQADVYGRMVTWALMFGVPSVVLTAVLWALTASPLGGFAIHGAISAAAVGCAAAPLLAVVTPAVGADARDRVYPGQQAGDPTGGQMTIFPVVLLAAGIPAVIGAVTGDRWWVTTLVTILLATAVLSTTPTLVVRLLHQRGTRLLDAMASRDTAALRPSTRTKG